MKRATRRTERSPSTQRGTAIPSGWFRKRLLVLPVVLGLTACGTALMGANVLYNGDLDILGAPGANGQMNAGPDGWNITAFLTISGPNNDGADSEPWCNVQQPGGYGLFFKPFKGSTNLLDDLLTVYFYQDNPATPGTKYTLSGYAAGEANYSGFIPRTPPVQTLFVVEFLDSGGTVINSNALDLITAGLPSGGPSTMAQFTMPEVTAPANTVTVRAGAFMINAYSTSGSQSFFVDAFDLESVAPPGSPVITNQPTAVTTSLGGTATFSVGVSNTAGVSYQWQLNNKDLTNSAGHIAGATTHTLTITGVGTNDIGHYRVVVSNAAGTVYSQTVPLAITGINFYPVVLISGNIGDTYRIDYATKLAPTDWLPLSTNKLTASPQLFLDSSSPGSNTRFYRAVFLH